MKRILLLLAIVFSLSLISCKDSSTQNLEPNITFDFSNISQDISSGYTSINEKTYKNFLVQKYNSIKPTKWSENMDGILSKVNTSQKIVYLTFDACGSPTGNKIDRELIDFLISENIKATLFINERWIDSNLNDFIALSKNPLFEIENHGTLHKPLSTTGESAYNIKGTTSPTEVYDEVENNSLKIQKLTGRRPLFFRSGTAYYDDVAVNLVNDMKYTIAGYNVLGDAGATLKKKEIIKRFDSFQNGSIFLFHMNHPESDTFEGLKEALPKIKEKGYSFRKLEEVSN